MADVHALIITLNEEGHIGRCIESLAADCASITVVDGGSTDATAAIAHSLGADVRLNPFVTHASQVNFAVDALSRRGGWLLRIDADEVLDNDSRQSLLEAVEEAAPDVDGLLVQRRIYFMRRRIRHGGIEPNWQLRLWRNGRGLCEQRWMDEHIKVDGRVAKSGIVLSDINLNSLSWWTAKHNNYASREALEVLNRRYGFMATYKLGVGASPQARYRRFLKEAVYGRVPGGSRALFYFLYRYVFRLGFLDGAPGWYFHLLQGLWYRTLVDGKVAEIEGRIARGASILDAIQDSTGISLHIPPSTEEQLGSATSSGYSTPAPMSRREPTR